MSDISVQHFLQSCFVLFLSDGVWHCLAVWKDYINDKWRMSAELNSCTAIVTYKMKNTLYPPAKYNLKQNHYITYIYHEIAVSVVAGCVVMHGWMHRCIQSCEINISIFARYKKAIRCFGFLFMFSFVLQLRNQKCTFFLIAQPSTFLSGKGNSNMFEEKKIKLPQNNLLKRNNMIVL